MRSAISEITTLPATFADDVAAYAAAGIAAIGLWEFKLPDDDAANRALIARHGLGIANCVPAIPSVLQLARPGMEGPADPEVRIAAICASVARLAAYGPESVVCLAGPLAGRDYEEGWAVLVAGLRRIVAAADAAGTRIAFEVMHPTQREETGFVTTLAEADRLLAEPGLERLGLLFDTYHLAEAPGVADWIAANSDRIFGVHVSDRPSFDRADRVLPGDGILPIAAAVEALRAAGWDGSLDVEVFSSPELFWSLPLDEAVRRAAASLVPLL